jgi:hypothetical protein
METRDDMPPIPDIPSPSITRIRSESALVPSEFDAVSTSITRDFAYDQGNPLFLRLDEPAPSDKEDQEAAARRTEALAVARAQQAAIHAKEAQAREQAIKSEDVEDPSSGWTDPPPWLATPGNATPTSSHMEEDAQDLGEGEVHGRAVALFDFTPEHENEFALVEGQQVFISSMHGLGWLVAVDPITSDCGLVPEEYVRFLADDEVWALQEEEEGNPEPSDHAQQAEDGAEDGWVDEPHQLEIDDDHASTEEELAAVLAKAEREMAMAEHRNMEDDVPT